MTMHWFEYPEIKPPEPIPNGYLENIHLIVEIDPYFPDYREAKRARWNGEHWLEVEYDDFAGCELDDRFISHWTFMPKLPNPKPLKG